MYSGVHKNSNDTLEKYIQNILIRFMHAEYKFDVVEVPMYLVTRSLLRSPKYSLSLFLKILTYPRLVPPIFLYPYIFSRNIPP